MLKRILLFLCCVVSSASAQTTSAPAPQSTPPAQPLPVIEERVEVTATRLPEDPQDVPSAVEVFNGDELRNRGYHDLRSALSFATGVEVAPGGDAGPASAVPDFWGLKELDAFLLVVDGVPWGGSFNPALTTLDLNDIERIEVVRGPAPVTYGATSFVGVIHSAQGYRCKGQISDRSRRKLRHLWLQFCGAHSPLGQMVFAPFCGRAARRLQR